MPIWKQKSPSAETKLTLQGPFPDLITRVLESRGIEQKQLEDLLQPKLSALKDPFKLLGMHKACQRIVDAFKKNQKICVYADFDLDGTSGLAILKIGLEKLGFTDVAYYQPRRLSEGYGFHAEAVEELKNLGIDLIITVDVGITSFAAFQKAKELGVDVILTDHHLPSHHLPEAYVVVNPNQKECESGLGYLCGAGVAFYLLRALRRVFLDDPELPKNEWDLKEVLEFFCIGTLTDMVPLVEDNRVLVKHGLLTLQKTNKPGLKALLEALNLNGRDLTSQDVAIRFAPKLNALSRMESQLLPAQIYLETDFKKAQQMIDSVLENNQTRQALQSEAEERALKMLESWQENDFVFVASEFFHRGIIGLIATKLSQTLNRPAFVGSLNSEGMIVGSARTPAGAEVSLVDVLDYCHDYLSRHGGHAAAAGFELNNENCDLFQARLKQCFQEFKTNQKPIEILYDTSADLVEVNQNAMKWYDFIGPFGVGFQVPILKFSDVMIHSVKDLKGGHIKLQLSDLAKSIHMDALLFSPTDKHKSLLQVGATYHVLCELQWNYFSGRKSIQLLIKDLKLNET